jgi:HTH-type transcriptional regulator/antitoxin HigA
MAIAEPSPAKYAKLLATALPKAIETRAEFDRAVTLMERLDRRDESGELLTCVSHQLSAVARGRAGRTGQEAGPTGLPRVHTVIGVGRRKRLPHGGPRLARKRGEKSGLSPEENPLRALLEQLIQAYDDKIELPAVSPLRILAYLMEQRGLRQADLLPVFGSRSVASDVLNGKRDLSKAHIRGLAKFFHVSPEVLF